MIRFFLHRLVPLVLIAVSPAAWAQGAAPANPTAPAAAQAQALSDAEVRRVDAAGGRVTLRHGPIPSLDMPGMTMQFQVKDAALLQGLKEGSRIRFAAEKINGQYTVTVIQPAP
jgi:Cu(I)/Ag(I) efflux system protein CusF